MLTRRRFLQAATLAAASTSLAGCGPDQEAKAVPPGVPLSAFGKESTSEEVTAGLDLSGRNVLITGVNSGLGLETMRVLAMRGAHVLGTARSMDKAREACASVQGKTTPLSLDLADFATVAACADAVRELGIPLDAVICNAGIMALPQLEQVHGIERHFVVNHLGHFVLVNRLLEQVRAAPQGRVVVVSSMGYRWAPANGNRVRQPLGRTRLRAQSCLRAIQARERVVLAGARTPARRHERDVQQRASRRHPYEPRPSLPEVEAGGGAPDRLDVHEVRGTRRRHLVLRGNRSGAGKRERPVLRGLQPRDPGRPHARQRSRHAPVGCLHGAHAASLVLKVCKRAALR